MATMTATTKATITMVGSAKKDDDADLIDGRKNGKVGRTGS